MNTKYLRHIVTTCGLALLLMLCGTSVETAHAQRAPGDVVNGDTLTYPSSTKSASSLSATPTSKSTSPSASINNINTRINLFELNCLFTFARVEVLDANGDAILGLGKADFTVNEDAVGSFKNPLDYFVIPPQGTSTTAADIIFAVDNSGSMGPFQTAIDNNFDDFLTALQNSGIDFQLGLVRYGQSGDGSYENQSGWPIIENGGNLTSNGTSFKDNIFSNNIASGGNEPGYEAIEAAVQRFNLRSEAQTIVIVVSDETLDQDTDDGAATEADALNALQGNNATLFSITDTSPQLFGPDLVAEAEALTIPTGGDVFDLNDNYNDILNSITAQIAGVYTVGYIPADDFTVPSPRDVEIDVDIGGGTTLTTPVSTYTPGAAPVIRRTAATASLLTTTGGTVDLSAEVKDLVTPGVSGVTLFYRTTGGGTYTSVAMTDAGGGVFEATSIPVSSPGIDYYFQTSDGTSTVTAPGADPAANPFQIGAGGNSAPTITHTPIASFTTGNPVTVSADVTDNGSISGTPTLFYRQQGRIGFQSAAMSNTGGDTFEANIPGSAVTSFGLDYYIAATDDEGVTRTFATPDFPVVVGGCVPVASCDVPTLGNDIVDNTARTVTNTMMDQDGIQSFTFTMLNNFTVDSIDPSSEFDASDSDGDGKDDTWMWTGSSGSQPTSVDFTLEAGPSGEASYFLETIDACPDGAKTTDSDPVFDLGTPVEQFQLAGNYPNPFSEQTTIEYTLPERSKVQVAVYDMMGRRVATLVDGPQATGVHMVTWNGESEGGQKLSSGLYLLRVQTDEQTATRRISLVR